MKVVKTIKEMQALRQQTAGSVGFVPTMGYLHDGHLTLVRRAKKENDIGVVSIFVNPTQFAPTEDFSAYPRDTERDLALLKKVNTDVVFMPLVEEMYPQGFCTWVDVKRITERLEGSVRPAHFRGVATVVNKLFNIVQPTKAYFGQKDAQQVLVIRQMAADLNMNLEVVTVATVREPDGLAMSSRNIYLNPKERQAALILWKALTLARQRWAGGERDAQTLHRQMTELIQTEPLASIDYISIADAESLEELDRIERRALVSMAVRVGKTRLIDNILLES